MAILYSINIDHWHNSEYENIKQNLEFSIFY